MPGAWEYAEGPDVCIGVLNTGLTTIRWAHMFKQLIVPSNVLYSFKSGLPFDVGRNVIVEDALKAKAKFLFFLDSDVIPPKDALTKLINHNLDIVSGVYYRRVSPIDPTMSRDFGNRHESIVKYNLGDVIEVDLVGMGCCLIRTHVFKALPKPWFKWTMLVEGIPRNQQCSEDYYFCRQAKINKFKIYVDTSIQCEHLGIGKASLHGFKPES